jgi:predicted HD phosphohydrolase
MNADEVAAFQKHPHLAEVVKVRHLDDRGKIAGLKTPEFSHYAPMVQRVVDGFCIP